VKYFHTKICVEMNKRKSKDFSYILPVLFYEYLAISITKSIIPKLLVDKFGTTTYLVLGFKGQRS
jgi:hypothetical protein